MINKEKFDIQYKKTLKILQTDNKDTRKRKRFIVKLAKKLLPMPQNEGQWHAAKIYVDERKESFYNVEQWEDYLKIKNKHPYYIPREEYRSIESIEENKNINRKKNKKKYRERFYYRC